MLIIRLRLPLFFLPQLERLIYTNREREKLLFINDSYRQQENNKNVDFLIIQYVLLSCDGLFLSFCQGKVLKSSDSCPNLSILCIFSSDVCFPDCTEEGVRLLVSHHHWNHRADQN